MNGRGGRAGLPRTLAALLLGVMLGAGAQTSRADLEAARAAVQRRDFTAALPLWQRLVQAQPGHADLLIEAARVHGWADRNDEAARLYRLALAAAPERRADIVPSLAWQTLWSGQAGPALALFGQWLQWAQGVDRADALDGLAQARQDSGDGAGALQAWREALGLRPGDLRLQRRLALALLWSDRHEEAIAALRAAAALAPQDRDIDWALANALNFSGRHATALQHFGRWAEPTRPGERADLARAWRWAGFEERALPLLEGNSDPESDWLRRYRVARELAPYAFATVERASDRDALRAHSSVLGTGWRPQPGSELEFKLRRVDLADPFGSPQASQFEASWRWRHGEPGSAWGTLWPQLSLRTHDFGSWRPVTPVLRLKWVPDDVWRWDAEATREIVETPRALANRVSVDVLSLAGSWRGDVRHFASGSLAALRFDDGTQRLRLQARAERALLLRPRWTAGIELMHFDRTQAGRPGADSRGYWNPSRYSEARLVSAVSHEVRPFDFEARIGLGTSREIDSGGRASSGSPHLWELAVGADLAPAWRLRVALGGSGQAGGLGGSGTGYWRRWASLSVNGWF